MPIVSLIVPCFESSDFLSSTIESVLHQELPDWELILVDDGSSDSTWQIISSFTRLDARITGFRTSNEGTARARIFGALKANPSSNYLWFLDHDDLLDPSALKKMCGYMDLHPEVGLLCCQFQSINVNGTPFGSEKRSRWVPGFIFPRKLRDDEIETPFVTFFCATGAGPFGMYRKSVYLQTEGWPTTFWPHEDTDLFCQMALLSPVHFLPDRFYRKRVHPAQGMGDRDRVQRAYGAFREKWDRRVPKNAEQAKLLRTSRLYYYSVHKPFRELEVAGRSLVKLIKHPNMRNLDWLVRLLCSALRGFLFGRFLSRVNSPRTVH